MRDNGTKINTKYLSKATLYHPEIPQDLYIKLGLKFLKQDKVFLMDSMMIKTQLANFIESENQKQLFNQNADSQVI